MEALILALMELIGISGSMAFVALLAHSSSPCPSPVPDRYGACTMAKQSITDPGGPILGRGPRWFSNESVSLEPAG